MGGQGRRATELAQVKHPARPALSDTRHAQPAYSGTPASRAPVNDPPTDQERSIVLALVIVNWRLAHRILISPRRAAQGRRCVATRRHRAMRRAIATWRMRGRAAIGLSFCCVFAPTAGPAAWQRSGIFTSSRQRTDACCPPSPYSCFSCPASLPCSTRSNLILARWGRPLGRPTVSDRSDQALRRAAAARPPKPARSNHAVAGKGTGLITPDSTGKAAL